LFYILHSFIPHCKRIVNSTHIEWSAAVSLVFWSVGQEAEAATGAMMTVASFSNRLGQLPVSGEERE
jgi:hypothetical protein